MNKVSIILLDDQSDVLSSLKQDLEILQKHFQLEDCECAGEALEVMEELEASGQEIALILSDHIMPDKNGIDFMVELSQDERFAKIRKVLITGQASHTDTINAINDASIDYYIAKPWSQDELLNVVKKMLTRWIVETEKNPMDYEGLVDSEELMKLKRSDATSY